MSDICKQDTDKVLLVEGTDDCHVVMALCAAHQVPETFGIYECNGDTKVLKRLNALIVRPDHPEVIGVMLDADTSLEGRWASIKGKLSHYSYKLPDIPDIDGTIVEGITDEPKLGFWLMPNNQDSGKLEDFCAELAEPTSLAFVRESIAEAQVNKVTTFKPLDISKAVIHTYLAWQDEPGRPMGQAITKQALRPNTDIARRFTNWLIRLFT
ncbi:DUF3226 domain-containing protein [Nostoc sp. JL33]|uniref:DUF3226 domain-containing protein n=1 Tax=Nostoc sp. JL33 TaxID=2815396 RepID=UPI0025D313AF|nr:DUF3226 domain-containing protein [Nostoc sp. JL33]MBN3872584.1 hypothetical protein [Nostoc sp. JL33]